MQIKELNRATLARQMLLARETMTPARALERLVGMQPQLARPPFVGLWSRLAGFRREQLIRSVERREVVRATFLAGIWKVSRKKDVAALVVEPFIPLSKDARRQLVEEGEQLLRFVEEGAHSFEVRLLEKK